MTIAEDVLLQLGDKAWQARANARIVGDTRVGSAVITHDGQVFVGCNVEHKFRCHDVHAEVNALSSMIAGGGRRCAAIVIAAERQRFTPCGGCMDWIMELGGPDTVVGFQGKPGGAVQSYTALDLMPNYPA